MYVHTIPYSTRNGVHCYHLALSLKWNPSISFGFHNPLEEGLARFCSAVAQKDVGIFGNNFWKKEGLVGKS